MSRQKVPKSLQTSLMYESAFVCVICQEESCHIHHIDRDHANNKEDNLVVLCLKHHDEAHTRKQLSKNLTRADIKEAKKKWCKAVADKRSSIATVSGQKALHNNPPGICWGYINHQRVVQMADPNRLDPEKKKSFRYCVNQGLIDQNAVVIKPHSLPQATSVIKGTIYNWFEFGDDQRVHLIYTALVDQIASSCDVVHMEPLMWKKSYVKERVKPGALLFLNQALYFKRVNSTNDNEHRRCRRFKRKIEIVFHVDTRNMFGVSSITASFTGHKSCASLVQFKSFEKINDGKLILHCTPIALGVGFDIFQPNA